MGMKRMVAVLVAAVTAVAMVGVLVATHWSHAVPPSVAAQGGYAVHNGQVLPGVRGKRVQVVDAQGVVDVMNQLVGEMNQRIEVLQSEIDTLAQRQEVLIQANADVSEVSAAPGGHAGNQQQQQQQPHAQHMEPHHQQQQHEQQRRDAGQQQAPQAPPQQHQKSLNMDVSALRQRAAAMNRAQTIQNPAICKQHLLNNNDDLVVFVVMAHNRLNYFEALLQSMRAVRYIEDAVLVVSQDMFSSEQDALLDSIDFMCVIRVFYPGSLQLNPDQFPGTDPNDCPRDISKEEALRIGCNNARNPDQYHHYREAQFTVIKHHWWWKLNFVFDHMPVLKNHNGLKVLLEEDHYLAPDTIHMLLKTWRVAQEQKHTSDIIVLGDYDAGHGAFAGNVVHRQPWVSTKHNMGMALSRQLFDKIKQCARMFCEFDDYNWDWSLFAVSARGCIDQMAIHALVMAGQRIQHLGVCGVHSAGKDCSGTDAIERAKRFNAANAAQMFPQSLQVVTKTGQAPFVRAGYGGWGDPRDVNLCLSFAGIDTGDSNTNLF
ncbi:hypothetical protein PTSG_08664 [Salpingoeca rosetta]|uniref:Alpha-1,6-mannosyl-glycoprotein 2-beta-N-acetylglucosaminyltransferase n=1 Tax=Salpingoeca rosetta (strain ATCC 50818 / BSB-021) TaxID=946362 RepID=F2UKB7_SALR5|nr:uncharacterized protein PTSG_08664 [Salpingoeca rosetta]EGD77566.1 hypothetical protein PTSG_08664 [Salpingoeca rosetta]|eukprot:XP_004990454.1 hypothetical protein PTSG_08664 [Salpingoeca rosetta]